MTLELWKTNCWAAEDTVKIYLKGGVTGRDRGLPFYCIAPKVPQTWELSQVNARHWERPSGLCVAGSKSLIMLRSWVTCPRPYRETWICWTFGGLIPVHCPSHVITTVLISSSVLGTSWLQLDHPLRFYILPSSVFVLGILNWKVFLFVCFILPYTSSYLIANRIYW